MKTYIKQVTIHQLMNVILSIDKVDTEPQRVLDCGPGLGVLNRFMRPTSHSSAKSIGSIFYMMYY